MKVHCTNCGCSIHVYFIYCPYCGSMGVQKTVPSKVMKEAVKDGYYCHSCRERNYKDALYCAYCSVNLFSKSGKGVLFCPECGEKNAARSKYCQKCGCFLTGWFQLKGRIADEIGYTGNFILNEKITGTDFAFITGEAVTIGRNDTSTLPLACKLVSKNHCVLNIKEMSVRDLDSSNGTFINRNKERITTARFEDMHELNIAGTFTFKVTASPGFFAMRLIDILDDIACKDCRHSEIEKKLYRRCFIFPLHNGDVNIRKSDGAVVEQIDPDDDYITVSFDDGKYYISDFKQGLEKYLIRKSFNSLPSNLQITFQSG